MATKKTNKVAGNVPYLEGPKENEFLKDFIPRIYFYRCKVSQLYQSGKGAKILVLEGFKNYYDALDAFISPENIWNSKEELLEFSKKHGMGGVFSSFYGGIGNGVLINKIYPEGFITPFFQGDMQIKDAREFFKEHLSMCLNNFKNHIRKKSKKKFFWNIGSLEHLFFVEPENIGNNDIAFNDLNYFISTPLNFYLSPNKKEKKER